MPKTPKEKPKRPSQTVRVLIERIKAKEAGNRKGNEHIPDDGKPTQLTLQTTALTSKDEDTIIFASHLPNPYSDFS